MSQWLSNLKQCLCLHESIWFNSVEADGTTSGRYKGSVELITDFQDRFAAVTVVRQ